MGAASGWVNPQAHPELASILAELGVDPARVLRDPTVVSLLRTHQGEPARLLLSLLMDLGVPLC